MARLADVVLMQPGLCRRVVASRLDSLQQQKLRNMHTPESAGAHHASTKQEKEHKKVWDMKDSCTHCRVYLCACLLHLVARSRRKAWRISSTCSHQVRSGRQLHSFFVLQLALVLNLHAAL